MERIKIDHLLHLLLIVLTAGMMWGCAHDGVVDSSTITEGEKGSVTISVKLPYNSNSSEPQTYASNGTDGTMLTEIVVNGKAIGVDASIELRDVATRAGAPEIIVPTTTINEIEVNELVVLAFDSNGRVIAAPIHVANTDITNNSFTIDVREDTHELVVLANINTTLASDLNAISAGQSKAFVLNKLQLAILSDFRLGTTNIPAWNATNIPMWGEEIINYSGDSTIIVDVELIRMMAKVDVNIPATAAINFKLESVRIYNYNSVGQVTPNLLLPNWATNPSVPTQPVVAIPSEVPVALVYTATDDRSCTNKIYTFEVNAGSANEEDLPTNTCIVIGGKYNDAAADSYYRIDFTNETSYLNLLRNHHYKVNVVAVSGPGHATPEDAFKAPFTDAYITIEEEANSYIIAPGSGAIHIPVSRVNKSRLGTQLNVNEAFNAHLVWTDSFFGLSATSNIKSIGKEGAGPTGYLVVEPGVSQGNAVVAIKNTAGTILWSWHIWVTDYEPTPSSTGGFMDRNLGAIGNTPGAVNTKGLLYQWGRKDPFPNSTTINDTAEPTLFNGTSVATGPGVTTINKVNVSQPENFLNSVANPTTYYYSTSKLGDWFTHTGSRNQQDDNLWGGGSTTPKTVYDPCPSGWRVPKINVLSSLEGKYGFANYGVTISNKGGFYPAAGLRGNGNENLANVGTRGYYWSANIDKENAQMIIIEKDGSDGTSVSSQSVAGRANGHSVRCVKE